MRKTILGAFVRSIRSPHLYQFLHLFSESNSLQNLMGPDQALIALVAICGAAVKPYVARRERFRAQTGAPEIAQK